MSRPRPSQQSQRPGLAHISKESLEFRLVLPLTGRLETGLRPLPRILTEIADLMVDIRRLKSCPQAFELTEEERASVIESKEKELEQLIREKMSHPLWIQANPEDEW